MVVNLNGVILPAEEARIPVLDHGLLYGDGLFETLAVREGRFFRLEAHLRRLAEGAGRLELPLPWSPGALAEAVRETARANGVRDGVLRLTVTRGEGPPLPDPSLCAAPSFLVTVRPAGSAPSGRTVSLCAGGAHPRTFIPGLKTLSYLPFQQARQAARQRGFDEGLLVHGDRAVEASTSNLFVVRQGELLTPDLGSGCLAGIGREAVLELAGRAGLAARETEVPLEWLADAEEVFLTSSVSGVVAVIRWEGAPVGSGEPGEVTRRMSAAFEELVRTTSEE
jgi:branched-chain amino acid aminotransferase